MCDDEFVVYKMVCGLSWGLLLLKLLNKFDGGVMLGLLVEFSGLYCIIVCWLLEMLQEEGFVCCSCFDDSFWLIINVC